MRTCVERLVKTIRVLRTKGQIGNMDRVRDTYDPLSEQSFAVAKSRNLIGHAAPQDMSSHLQMTFACGRQCTLYSRRATDLTQV